MKTKTALLMGIICSLIMIGYSIYQGGVVYDEKKKHYDQLEKARHEAAMQGSTVEETSGLSSYAIATRTAGKVVMGLTAILMIASIIGIRSFKKNKGLFIFHIVGILVVSVSAIFSLVMATSTGGATFDETFVVWVLFGTIGLVLYGISLLKLPKIAVQYS